MRTVTSESPKKTDILGVSLDDAKSMVLVWPTGDPVLAGQIKAGETVVFERSTGVVLRIKKDTRRKK
jgi:hypothetical protein